MKKFITLSFFTILLLCGMNVYAFKKSIVFTTSEPEAKIYVDNQYLGEGKATIIVLGNSSVCVKVEKSGFLPISIYFYNKKGFANPPKTYYCQMTRDDSYDASAKNDYANKDFEQEVSTKYNEEAAWKIISQIITSYFDILEKSDKSTGYMLTSWQSQNFSQITVRTRILVKQSSSDPLKYKLKLISEYATSSSQNIKEDEKFKEWDRVLKKYEPIFDEFHTKLSKK